MTCVNDRPHWHRSIAQTAGLNSALVPVPFPVWHTLARAAELLPDPPIARNQIELMRIDNVASPILPGLTDVGIVPEPIESVVRSIMSAKRTDVQAPPER